MLTELGVYKLLGENPERAWPFARAAVIPVLRLIAPSYGYGHDRLPQKGGLVVAANHFSEVDPAILGLHSRRTLYYMAKIELLEVPVAGELLRWTGAFAVRRGEGDRDSIRVARWAVSQGHALGVFAEGTRQQVGHPGQMHPGAVMIALQEGVPVVPCALDTFGWSLKNRRPCAVVWGDPIDLGYLPRNGKGYKEGTAIVQERVHDLWLQAAQAVADGFPDALPDGARRATPIRVRSSSFPGLPKWPGDEWAEGPLGPVFPGEKNHKRLTRPLRNLSFRR